MATRREVAAFLGAFKVAMDFGFFIFVDRERNLQGLADLGIGVSDAKKAIAGLTPDNYSSGPEADHDGSSDDVWLFGTEVEGTEVYTKLKLVQDPKKRSVRWAKVLGFHPAERPISYPLRSAGS